MKIIDCNCAIGYRTVNYEVVNHEHFFIRERVDQARDAEQLLEQLDFCGIEGAVVYHNAMVDVSPGSGNQYIIEEVNKAGGRLFPTWTILPPITEAEFAPEPLFRRMKEYGVRMLRAYPERNRYLLNAVTMGELVREIESARIPLYLSPSTGWQDIYTILQQFPGLTVMIHNYGLWSSNRFLYPLLQAYPNVYIESGDMQTAGEIKDICRKFGSEKIVFGSDYPSNHMGGPLSALLGADISREERANIAHRNIERIWSEVRL